MVDAAVVRAKVAKYQSPLYLGRMNGLLYIMDAPFPPEGLDLYDKIQKGVRCFVSHTWGVPEDTVKKIVADHNASLTKSEPGFT